MLGLSIFSLVSGGINIISSALVIAQGALWLNTTASVPMLAKALAEVTGAELRTAANGCCSGTFVQLRGLAIAAIVFACFEMIVGFALGFGISIPFFLEYTGGDTSFLPLAGWFIHVVGNAAIVGALNISMSVATLNLLQVFSVILESRKPAPSAKAAIPDGPATKVLEWAASGAATASFNPVAAATQGEV